MIGSIVAQGSFKSTGANKLLVIRSDFDRITIYNETNSIGVEEKGFQYYWQRGMTNGLGLMWYHPATDHTVAIDQVAANSGFFIYDSSNIIPEASYALTGMTAANPPVISSATLPKVGDIIRLSTLNNQKQFGGIDFTVSVSGGGTFTIGNIVSTNSTPSTSGSWRRIPYDPMFYPRNRTISYVRPGTTTKIYTTVTHGYHKGQTVRLSFPTPATNATLWGDFAKLDNQVVTITNVDVARAVNEPTNAVGPNNIIVDFDSTGYQQWETVFGALSNQYYPDTSKVPFTPPQVIPVGVDVAQARTAGVDELLGAVRNAGAIGVTLVAGAKAPGGLANDVIYWVAEKAWSVNNE